MEKYKDIPMDFADATLVVLAEETGIDEVLTLDMRGFSAYRIHGIKAFTRYGRNRSRNEPLYFSPTRRAVLY